MGFSRRRGVSSVGFEGLVAPTVLDLLGGNVSAYQPVDMQKLFTDRQGGACLGLLNSGFPEPVVFWVLKSLRFIARA